MTLVWTDTAGVARRATYSFSTGGLERLDENGDKIRVIDSGVVTNSVKFSRCTNLLTLDLEVEADRGDTETMALRSYLRKLQ